MLTLEGVCSSYGGVAALRDCSLSVPEGAIVTVLGANGAGKTTTLNCVMGLQKWTGSILLDGVSLRNWRTDRIVRAGVSLVPESRALFAEMSVEDNLRMGAYVRGLARTETAVIGEIFDLFPELSQRRSTMAGMLSGGQQQMLAIGRALMAKPRLLLLDEPSTGLAPMLFDRILKTVIEINKRGVTILLVEQNAYRTLPISTRVYVLETGSVVLSGGGAALLEDDRIRASYLGEV